MENNVTENETIKDEFSMILPEHIREVFAKATCLYSKIEVEAALNRMAAAISQSLSQSNPIFLCVVVGGIVPLGNLLPHLENSRRQSVRTICDYKKPSLL